MADEKIISVRLRALTADLESGMRRAGASIRGFQSGADRDMRTLGTSMRNAGRSMTVGLTVPIAAGFAFAVRETVSFESAMAGVAKTLGLSADETEVMAQGIRDMAMRLPATREEIAGVAEAAGQLGIQRENILSFTETMINMGEATNLSADQAATSLAQFANITQMPQSQFEQLGSTVVALGNAGASTESQIVDMGLRLAAAGSAAGLSEAEILAFASSLGSLGIEAEAGGTAMSQAFIRMTDAVTDGGPKLEAFAEAAGMTSEAFARMAEEDPAGAMGAFVTGLDRMAESGQSVTPILEELGLNGTRARQALIGLGGAGTRLADDLRNAGEGFAENAALAEEAARRYDTVGARMEIAWNQITDASMVAGDALAPVVEAIARAGADLAGVFSGLPGPIQGALISLAALAAVAGPMLWAVGGLTNGWATFGTVLPGVSASLTAFAVSVRTTITALATAHPVIAAATAALLAFYALSSQDFSTAIGENADRLAERMTAAGSAVDGLVASWTAADAISEADVSPEWIVDAGISLEELAAAMLAGGDAWETMMGRLESAGMGSSVLAFLDVAASQARAAADALGEIEPPDPESAEGLAIIAEEAATAAAAASSLEDAWASLNNLLSDTQAAIAARQSMRALTDSAFAALEGGVTPAELDEIRSNTIAHATDLRDMAEAANTNAEGVKNAAGAQRDFLAAMRAARDEIPASVLPMWDRMIATLNEPITPTVDGSRARNEAQSTSDSISQALHRQFLAFLDANGIPARSELAATLRVMTPFNRRRFLAYLDADPSGAENALTRAMAAGNSWAGQTFIASFTGQTSGSLAGGGTYDPPGGAAGGIIRARAGGQLLRVGEAGHDELLMSFNPRHAARNRGLMAQSGLDRALGFASGGQTMTREFHHTTEAATGSDRPIEVVIQLDGQTLARQLVRPARAQARASL